MLVTSGVSNLLVYFFMPAYNISTYLHVYTEHY